MKKRFFAIMTIAALLFSCFSANAAETNMDGASALNALINQEKVFTVADVKSALLPSQYGTIAPASTQKSTNILKEVLQPGSMGIEIPKIDASKVLDIYDDYLREMKNRDFFYEELVKHGVSDQEMATMTHSEYEALEATWLMDADLIKVAKTLYPDLKDVNMADWTIGEYNTFVKADNVNRLADRFTQEQLAELKERGILLEDTFYLFKEYHTADNILQQTDSTLKSVLEGYYAFNLERTLGTGTVDQLMSSQTIENEVSIASTPSYTIPSNKASYYAWVDFPLYGGDYFHNDVQTSVYWRNIQAYRTLLTQCTIYGQLYTGNNTLYCSNLYGTYSTSQGGAHEGIDFASGTSRTIYSPVEGKKLSTSKSHHLAIYDASHPDGAKTYNFLHMTNRTTSSNILVGQTMGTQGMEGNATGYHVHFEVHSGKTTGLSSESNQSVDSLSPYRLTEYIGEAEIPN